MKRKYTAIIFDVGDTLVKWHPSWAEVYTARLRTLGLTVDDSLSLCISDATYDADYEQIRHEQDGVPHLPPGEYSSMLDRVALKCFSALPEPIDVLADKMKSIPKEMQEMRVIPGVLGILEELKNCGYRLAIVSNHHVWLRNFLKENGMLDYFEAIVISEEVHIEKPNTKIMEIALEQLRLSASECLYVGDRPYDVLCAKKAGLDMAWIAPKDKRLAVNIGYSEDYHIASVLDILEILK